MNGAQIWTPYCGPGPTPGEWFSRWNFDPPLLAALALGLALVLMRTSGRERVLGAAALLVLTVTQR